MTGRPAALRALAFASTASVADSAMPPTSLEMRGRPDAGVEVPGGVAASVMAPSFHRRPDPDTRVRRTADVPVGRQPTWLGSTSASAYPYTFQSVGLTLGRHARNLTESERPARRRNGRPGPDEPPKGTSSTGRASVSKTEGWGFKSLVPCESRRGWSAREQQPGRANRQQPGREQRRERWRTMSDSRSVSSSRNKRTSPATFYRQVVAELRKVVWPTQQQLITYFSVVLVFVVVIMAIVSLLDVAFGKMVFAVFG